MSRDTLCGYPPFAPEIILPREALNTAYRHPAVYRAFRDGFEEEIEVLERAAKSNEKSLRREIAAAEKRVAHYVNALGSGLLSEAVTRELQKAEQQVATLRARLVRRRPSAPPSNLPELFRAEFRGLVEGLGGPQRLEAQEQIRRHVDHVLVPEGDLPLRLVGNAATLIGPESGSIVGCGGGI